MILIDANNWRWWRYFQLEKILHFLSSLLNNYHHILSAVSSIPSYSCYLFFLTSPQIVILRVSGLCKNPIFMMSSCFPCRSATRSKKWSECMYTKVEEKNIYGINPISRLGTKKKDKHAIDGPQVWAKSCWWYFGLKFNCSRSSSVNFSRNYSTLLLAESNNFVTIWCNDNKRVIHLL